MKKKCEYLCPVYYIIFAVVFVVYGQLPLCMYIMGTRDVWNSLHQSIKAQRGPSAINSMHPECPCMIKLFYLHVYLVGVATIDIYTR